tara:strand:+ start:201 stop:971 length:771 start_codon:yes stop_codon:yes gene_type:complete
MMAKLSVFIITYNEERILDKCLNKLSWVDEIVVVDSGSTDATLDICKKYHVKVFHNDFQGFGAQKQFALEKTSNDWVLSLDADEILSNELIDEIKEVLIENTDIAGYFINRQHVFLDKVFNYGQDSKKCVLRLFKKSKGKFDGKMVHETIVVTGNTGNLKNSFLHFTARSLEHYLEKINTYATIFAEGQYLKNKKYSILEIALKVKLEFLKKYFLNLNILNGKEGFYWSFLGAYSSGLKYIKTNEQYKKVKKQLMF